MKIDQTRTLQLLDQRIIRLNRPCFHGCYPTVWDASPLVSSASLPSLRTVPCLPDPSPILTPLPSLIRPKAGPFGAEMSEEGVGRMVR